MWVSFILSFLIPSALAPPPHVPRAHIALGVRAGKRSEHHCLDRRSETLTTRCMVFAKCDVEPTVCRRVLTCADACWRCADGVLTVVYLGVCQV